MERRCATAAWCCPVPTSLARALCWLIACLFALTAGCASPAAPATVAPPSPTAAPPTTVAAAQATDTRVALPTTAPTWTPTVLPTSRPASPTATIFPHLPLPTPRVPLPTPVGTAYRHNGLFDVVAVVDASAREVKRADVERVFNVAAAQLAARTGQWMRLVDVVYGLARPTTGNEYAQVQNLALAYLRTVSTKMPEGVIVFTDTETCKLAGGFSVVVTPPTPFDNEYKSPRPEVGGNKIYTAAVDYHHIYGQCGYDAVTALQQHVSDVSIDGECRNHPGLKCVPRGERWVCPNVQQNLYYDDDYFIAGLIVHEFIHPFGISKEQNYDHYASSECIARGGVSPMQVRLLANDVYDAERNLGFCPDVFARFRRSP